MRDKKTEVITVRIPPKTKLMIEKESMQREWTVSKTAEKILTQWAEHAAQEVFAAFDDGES